MNYLLWRLAHLWRVVLLVFCLTATQTALSAWELTRFEIYQGPPADKFIDDEDASLLHDANRLLSWSWQTEEEGREGSGMNKDLIKETELFMQEVAQEFSRLGFPDPVPQGGFDSIVEGKNGDRVIRVYAYAEPTVTDRASYQLPKPCNEAAVRNFIFINLATFGTGPNPTVPSDQDYLTLAHELFHATMSQSTFRNGYYRTGRPACKKGKWLHEGLADTIGLYMARELRNITFDYDVLKYWNPAVPDSQRKGDVSKIFGIRDYSEPLNRPKESNKSFYATSSFWQYIGEVAHSGRQRIENPKDHVPHAGSRHYLPTDHWTIEPALFRDMLNTDYYGNGDTRRDLDWLNDFLKRHKYVKTSLPQLHAQFLAAMTDQVNTRINPQKAALKLPPSKFGKVALGLYYSRGGCNSTGALEPNQPLSNVRLNLNANAGGCLIVDTPSGTSQGGNVVIQSLHQEERLLKQLRIGLLDGTWVMPPEIWSVMGDGPPFIAKWELPLYAFSDGVVIVTNMAAKPSQTRVFEPEFNISLDTSNNNIWQGPLPPSQPAPGPGPKPTRREVQRDHIKRAARDPVPFIAPANKVERKQWNHPCDLSRRQYNRCSAQLVISLDRAPMLAARNATDDHYHVSQALFDPASDRPAIDVARAQMEAGNNVEKFLESKDASRVTIALPKVDYGFTGSFDNASIRVSKAGGGAYLSYGPGTRDGNLFTNRPPNGHVTIDDYSLLVLRGSFRASLVDLDNTGKDDEPIVARHISGTFNIPAPYILDDGFEMDEDQIKQAAISNMIRNTPFGAEVLDNIIQSTGGKPPQIMCDEGIDDELLSAMGFSEGCGEHSGQMASQCTCDCEKRVTEEPIPACSIRCEREWEACKLKDEPLSAELSAQIAEYSGYLAAQNLPPEIIDSLVTAFRDMPQWQRDLTLQGFR